MEIIPIGTASLAKVSSQVTDLDNFDKALSELALTPDVQQIVDQLTSDLKQGFSSLDDVNSTMKMLVDLEDKDPDFSTQSTDECGQIGLTQTQRLINKLKSLLSDGIDNMGECLLILAMLSFLGSNLSPVLFHDTIKQIKSFLQALSDKAPDKFEALMQTIQAMPTRISTEISKSLQQNLFQQIAPVLEDNYDLLTSSVTDLFYQAGEAKLSSAIEQNPKINSLMAMVIDTDEAQETNKRRR